MEPRVQEVCHAPGGEIVNAAILKNSAGMQATVLTWGATLSSLKVADRDGRLDDVVLGFPSPEGFLQNAPYFGATCGRYANRIARGQFEIDGNSYSVPCNNGPNHLHGGLVGLTRRNWELVDAGQREDRQQVLLRVVSPDGDEGYPGQLSVELTVTLTESHELSFDYLATCDRPTVLNLTNHAYWNLAGTSPPASSVMKHVLQLQCDKFLPVDDVQIPTGELQRVDGGPMDFREPQPIGQRIDQVVGGYDHCFVIRAADGSLRSAAVVSDPSSGRTMEVATTEPGIQLYTGNFLTGADDCAGFPARSGLCLECQHFPDAPNQPAFPGTVLRPGEEYRQTTVHRFGVTPG